MDVDVQEAQLPGYEVRVAGVPRPGGGVGDVEAGVDARAGVG